MSEGSYRLNLKHKVLKSMSKVKVTGREGGNMY